MLRQANSFYYDFEFEFHESLDRKVIYFPSLFTLKVQYTIGGVENLKIAKKYYASAIKLSAGKNLRALYGLCLVKKCLFI